MSSSYYCYCFIIHLFICNLIKTMYWCTYRCIHIHPAFIVHCTVLNPFVVPLYNLFFLHRCTLFHGTVVNSFIVPFYTLLLYRCALYYCTVVNHLRLFSLNIHVGHNIDAYTFENWVLCTAVLCVCLYSVHVLYTHQLRTDDESMYQYNTVVQMYSVRLVSTS